MVPRYGNLVLPPIPSTTERYQAYVKVMFWLHSYLGNSNNSLGCGLANKFSLDLIVHQYCV